MEESNPQVNSTTSTTDEVAPKWDYTSREQTLFTGALVVGLNLLVILAFVLYRYVPAFHSLISGKPL